MMKDESNNGFMARLQLEWAWIVKRDLGKLPVGTKVKYLNTKESGQSNRDTTYKGIATVMQFTEGKEDLITKWEDRVENGWVDLPTNKIEEPFWHLPKKKCFLADESGIKVLVDVPSLCVKDLIGGTHCLEDLEAKEEWIRLERHGPEFPKLKINKILYEAQLRSRVKISQKINKMEKLVGRDVQSAIRENWASQASSKVKGFMWLF